jgi:hypothetical protein
LTFIFIVEVGEENESRTDSKKKFRPGTKHSAKRGATGINNEA